MTIEIKVPSPGESITEVQISNLLVADGTYVEKDQEVVEIDSDKATLSVAAEASGIIHFFVTEGSIVEVGSVLAKIELSERVDNEKSVPTEPKQTTSINTSQTPAEITQSKPLAESKPAVVAPHYESTLNMSPLARKMMEAENLSEIELLNFFKHYRLGKKDIAYFKENKDNFTNTTQSSTPVGEKSTSSIQRSEERKKMSMLRKKLAARLVSVKNETAMLTTFNEVNMSPIMEMRNKYKEAFKARHNVNLGFMSFFTKAVTEALKHFPQINAQINGDEIIHYDYADISIAVSGPKGLVVPVIRNAERLSLAQIELTIKELAIKARENKLTIEEMTGGTFTITNGGVFGSMLSTPIINPPQSAILGMHNIVERPIAVNGKVEIHPIMYVALSYDHRIIDGRESVGFLVMVKEMLENPIKMLFNSKDPAEALLDL